MIATLKPGRMICLVLAALVAGVGTAAAFGPHIPSPHDVVNSAHNTAAAAKHAEQQLVNNSFNTVIMRDNVTGAQNLVYDSHGKEWTDDIKGKVETDLKKAPGLKYLQDIASWSTFDKGLYESTRDVAAVLKAMKAARDNLAKAEHGTWDRSKWADRLLYLQAQFNDVLGPLLDILDELDPLKQIEASLKKSAPGADVSLGKDPATAIRAFIAKASGEKETDIDAVLKPIALAPRWIENAQYLTMPSGSPSNDCTQQVNANIVKNQGVFLKLAPHPQYPNTKDLCGEPAFGKSKVLLVRDYYGQEYYWSEDKEIRFLVPETPWTTPPVRVGTSWQDFKFVVAGDNDNLFAVQKNGHLLHYRYDGRTWAVSGKKIDSGWQHYTHVFGGPGNVIYAIAKNGDLLWHQWTDKGWAAGHKSRIGTGWSGFSKVFTGGENVIYAINKDNATLHRYTRQPGSSENWQDGGSQIGTGWGGFSHVFGAPGGLVFAIKDGSVRRYKRPNQSGEHWEPGSGREVATGWTGYKSVFSGDHGKVYAIVAKNGDLRQAQRSFGSYWVGNTNWEIGTGWDFKFVTASDDNHIFAVRWDGALLHYVHKSGTKGLSAGEDTGGSGWDQFTHVFAGPDNVLYAITGDGQLKWYKWEGYNKWAKGSGNVVGTGWDIFKFVFHGGDNVIYGVNKNTGALQWYKHLGGAKGHLAKGSGKAVGSGWEGFSHVFGAPGGLIYAINGEGTMLRYKRSDGPEKNWQPRSETKIGTGWSISTPGPFTPNRSFKHVFTSNGREVYAINGSNALKLYLRARD